MMKTQNFACINLGKINKVLVLFFFMLSMSFSLHAQQFDNAYLKWKAEQQAQDDKLKKVDNNYYLSKPSGHGNKIENSVGKSPTIKSSQSQPSSGSKINLNSADVGQLQQLSGVGAKKAQAIIDYRNQNGKFNSIDDLQKVKGIGPKLLEKNRGQLGL